MASSRRTIHFARDDAESRLSPIAHDPRTSAENNEKATSVRSEPASIPDSPTLLRRKNRSATVQTVFADHSRPDWHAGQEPGLDPSKPNGGRSATPLLHEECQITVVDYSETDMRMHYHGNASFIEFLKVPQEDWVKCRWINVNGLSWDIVQALGKEKKFHKLAIEDVTNPNNRTKADWYTEHTYIVMTLQKLVHLDDDECTDLDSDDATIGEDSGGFLRSLFRRSRSKKSDTEGQESPMKNQAQSLIRTPMSLHGYGGGRNQERAAYMKRNSALTKNKLAVSAEQVSIFLTADNTVISFFGHSAEDLETPILRRLSTPDTILRRSCDASMLVQALIDGIIDLAIPIAMAYQDIIAELELNVLTEPSITHTTNLYILTSEMTKIRNFVSPAMNLISALREHKRPTADIQGSYRADMMQASGVTISPMAQIYLGDVEDHIILVTETLDSMRRSCDNMIDLIFNTIAAYQNESMKQLTVVTIIFLPLSFMTGYFGMNIVDFPSIHHNESYFWIVAGPVCCVVALFLMKDILKWYFTTLVQKRRISNSRKGRQIREKNI